MPDIFFPRLEDMLFLRQPSAHWQVVELQTEPGCCYRNRTGDECLGPGFTKREELLLDEPRIEVIHKRIVHVPGRHLLPALHRALSVYVLLLFVAHREAALHAW